MKKLVTLVFVGVVANAGFASGFKCSAVDGSTLKVKLFNHVSGATRTPAVMVISDEDGTLVQRNGSEIRKNNRLNTVQYVIAGNGKLNADKAILQISFKEGAEVLEDNEITSGQLILTSESEKSVVPMFCARYLKQ